MKVNILLSAYNGEKYLREQVESIRKQSFHDWNLLIRDDGSQDSTADVIRELSEEDSRIRFINDGNIVNVGVIRSFYELLKYEQADYYLFCDQDDYWLADKVKMQVRMAQKSPESVPYMNYMDPVVVNAELKTINPSMIRSQSGHANTTLTQELTENTVTGGVSLINHALAEKWTNTSEEIVMHDWYLALVAVATGRLEFIDQPGELYRQHETNVLGARTLSKRIRTFANPRALVRKYWWLITSSQKQAKLLLENADYDLSTESKELIESYVNILDVSFMARLKTLLRHKLRKNKFLTSIAFWILILTKWGLNEK